MNRRLSRLSCALCLLLGGCVTVNPTHVPTTALPGELIWKYRDELKLQKDGREIDLSELAREVSCVPKSVQDAERGSDLSSSGNTWTVLGVTTLLAGMVSGTTLIIMGAAGDDDGLLYGGLGALGGGLVLGLTFTGVGSGKLSEGQARRLDAVNRYNDEVRFGTACGAAVDRMSRPHETSVAPPEMQPPAIQPPKGQSPEDQPPEGQPPEDQPTDVQPTPGQATQAPPTYEQPTEVPPTR